MGLRLALEHDVSLTPPPESWRRVGAIEATERVVVAHGLMRPHSRVSRRGYVDVGTVGYVFFFGQPVVSRFGGAVGEIGVGIPAFAGMTGCERPE